MAEVITMGAMHQCKLVLSQPSSNWIWISYLQWELVQQSWTNLAERVMSILSIAFQNVALERESMDDQNEKVHETERRGNKMP